VINACWRLARYFLGQLSAIFKFENSDFDLKDGINSPDFPKN
jgi:hypothetical protein